MTFFTRVSWACKKIFFREHFTDNFSFFFFASTQKTLFEWHTMKRARKESGFHAAWTRSMSDEGRTSYTYNIYIHVCIMRQSGISRPCFLLKKKLCSRVGGKRKRNSGLRFVVHCQGEIDICVCAPCNVTNLKWPIFSSYLPFFRAVSCSKLGQKNAHTAGEEGRKVHDSKISSNFVPMSIHPSEENWALKTDHVCSIKENDWSVFPCSLNIHSDDVLGTFLLWSTRW